MSDHAKQVVPTEPGLWWHLNDAGQQVAKVFFYNLPEGFHSYMSNERISRRVDDPVFGTWLGPVNPVPLPIPNHASPAMLNDSHPAQPEPGYPWQPIADAPRDGTPVYLLSAPYHSGEPENRTIPSEIFLGQWNPDGVPWVGDDLFNTGTGKWRSCGAWFEPGEVTHFMPMPRIVLRSWELGQTEELAQCLVPKACAHRASSSSLPTTKE